MTLETIGIIIGGLIFGLIPFGMLIYCTIKDLTEKKLWGICIVYSNNSNIVFNKIFHRNFIID